jgi:hypothetical protein
MPKHFSPEVLEWLEKNPGYRVVGPDTEDDPNRGAGSYQSMGDWLSYLDASGILGPALEYDPDLADQAEQRTAEGFGGVDPAGGEGPAVKPYDPFTGEGYQHELEGRAKPIGDTPHIDIDVDDYRPNRGIGGSVTNQLKANAREQAIAFNQIPEEVDLTELDRPTLTPKEFGTLGGPKPSITREPRPTPKPSVPVPGLMSRENYFGPDLVKRTVSRDDRGTSSDIGMSVLMKKIRELLGSDIQPWKTRQQELDR